MIVWLRKPLKPMSCEVWSLVDAGADKDKAESFQTCFPHVVTCRCLGFVLRDCESPPASHLL